MTLLHYPKNLLFVHILLCQSDILHEWEFQRPRSSKFHMAQSRKRIYVVLVRTDVVSKRIVYSLDQIVNAVLPRAIYTCESDDSHIRETVQQVRYHNVQILEALERAATMPAVSQEIGSGEIGQWLSVAVGGCRGVFGEADFQGPF